MNNLESDDRPDISRVDTAPLSGVAFKIHIHKYSESQVSSVSSPSQLVKYPG